MICSEMLQVAEKSRPRSSQFNKQPQVEKILFTAMRRHIHAC